VKVRVINSLQELRDIRLDWNKLVACAREQNINYEPTPLISLLDNLVYTDWFVVTVWSDDALCGFFPMQKRKRNSLPILQLTPLFKNHISIFVPLIDNKLLIPTLNAYWRWFNEEGKPKILHIPELLPTSYVSQTFLKTAKAHSITLDLSRKTTRALGKTDDDYNAYFLKTLSAKSRGAYRRKKRNIEKHVGVWRTEIIDGPDERLDTFIDHLIEVEGSGWKYKNGSAIKQHPGIQAFILELMHWAAVEKRLLLAISFVGNRAASAISGFINDRSLFIYKIGFDESLKSYSVGESTMMDVIEYAHSSEMIDWIDSVADENVEMWNRGLSDRQAIHSYNLGSNNLISKIMIIGISKSRFIRNRIKHFYLKSRA